MARPNIYWVHIMHPASRDGCDNRWLQHSNLAVLKGLITREYPQWQVIEWGKYVDHPLSDEERGTL